MISIKKNVLWIMLVATGCVVIKPPPDRKPVSFEDTFGQATIQPLIADDITRGELLNQLKKRCATEVEAMRGHFVWKVDPRPDLDQQRFLVRISDVPLKTYLDRICTLFDLKIWYGETTLAIGDKDDCLAPVVSRRFPVLPGFWEMVRLNTPELKKEGQPTARQAQTLLESLGIGFPAGTGIEGTPNSQILVVRNTEANLKKINFLLETTYLKPHTFDIGVQLVSGSKHLTSEDFFTDTSEKNPPAMMAALFAREKLTRLTGGTVDVANGDPEQFRGSFQLANGSQGKMVFKISNPCVLPQCTGVEIDLEVRISIEDLGYQWIHTSSLTLPSPSCIPIKLPLIQEPDGKTETLHLVISNLFTPFDTPEFSDNEQSQNQTEKGIDPLKKIVLPRIDFDGIHLVDAANRVAELARKNDPSGKGVNINMVLPLKRLKKKQAGDFDLEGPGQNTHRMNNNGDNPDSPFLVNIAATDIPLMDACRFVTEVVGCESFVDGDCIWFLHPDFLLEKMKWTLIPCPKDIFMAFDEESGELIRVEPKAHAISFIDLKDYFKSLGFEMGTQGWARSFPLPRIGLIAVFAPAESIPFIRSFYYPCDGPLFITDSIKTHLQGQTIPVAKLEKIIPAIKRMSVNGCQKNLEDAVASASSGTLFDVELLGKAGKPATLAFHSRAKGQPVGLLIKREVDEDKKNGAQGKSHLSLRMAVGTAKNVSWESQQAWFTDTPQFFRLGNIRMAGNLAATCLLVKHTNSVLDEWGHAIYKKSRFEADKRSDKAVPKGTKKACPHLEDRVFDAQGVVIAKTCAIFLDEPWLIKDAKLIRNGSKLWTTGHERPLAAMSRFLGSIANRKPVQYRLSIRDDDSKQVFDYFLPCQKESAWPQLKLGIPGLEGLSFYAHERVRGKTIRLQAFLSGKHVGTYVLDTKNHAPIPELKISLNLDAQYPRAKYSDPSLEDLLREHNRRVAERLAGVESFCKKLNQTPIPDFNLKKATLHTAIDQFLNGTGESPEKIQYILPGFPWPYGDQSASDEDDSWAWDGYPRRPKNIRLFSQEEGVALLQERKNVEFARSDLCELISVARNRKMTMDLSGKTPTEIIREFRDFYHCRMEVVDGKLCILPILDLPMEVMPLQRGLLDSLSDEAPDSDPSSQYLEKRFARRLKASDIYFGPYDFVWIMPASQEILVAGSNRFLNRLRQFLDVDTKPQRTHLRP